jgi:hypothetical protein
VLHSTYLRGKEEERRRKGGGKEEERGKKRIEGKLREMHFLQRDSVDACALCALLK